MGAQRMTNHVNILRPQSVVLLQLLHQVRQLEAHEPGVGRRLGVQRQRSARPVHDNDVQVAAGYQLVAHISHPVGERSIDESVNDELGAVVGIEVGAGNCLVVLGHQHLAVRGILLGEEQEPRVDDGARQGKHIERPMDEVIPVTGDVEASDLAKATGFIFNWNAEAGKEEEMKCGLNDLCHH